MAGPIPLAKSHNLVHRSLAVRRLGQALVDEGFQPPVVVPFDIAAERPVANAQDPGGLLLREPFLCSLL